MQMTAILATAFLTASPGAWRSYEVYQPTVSRHYVIDASNHTHTYNHCPTLAWFQDRWFCLWGSHVPIDEHTPGQRMVVSTSRDGRAWTPIERVFSSGKHSQNPVRYPEGKGHQWQPNAGVVDGELWVLWNQGGSAHDFRGLKGKRADDLRGLYFSRLKRADGKWVNRRLLWDGQREPVVDGKPFHIASTQNLIRLRSGRVLAPVTLYASGRAADAPEKAKSWWAMEKRNTVIYTDDLGQTWRLGAGCTTPGASWAQWEPTVWEQPDGTVMMVARNNTQWSKGYARPTSAQYLLWSVSRDQGATWSPHGYVPMESVCSRMHVAPLDGRGVWAPARPTDDFTGRRTVMVHNDAPGAVYGWTRARRNLALFFTRGGGFDFTAGPTISYDDPRACYPQMWRHGDTLAVCYTRSDPAARSIRVALVSPLPRPDRYYLFPRFNDVTASPRPKRAGDVWTFNGAQHIAMREPVDPGAHGFSLGAWVRSSGYGALLDTRTPNVGGFLLMLDSKRLGGKGAPRRRCPAACLLTKPHVFGPTLGVPEDRQWHYVGMTADNRTGKATFYVDGQSETVRFQAPTPQPLKGARAHIGAKSYRASAVPGLTGDIRFMALVAGPGMGADQHRWLYNRHADELGRPKLAPGVEPAGQRLMWMDPADAAGFKRDFVVPGDAVSGGSETATVAGRRVLRLRDRASVGVDLDENRRDRGDLVRLRFQFKVEAGDGQTVCTVGDFNHPARLVVRDRQVLLCAGKTSRPCGALDPAGWTRVWVETGRGTARVRVADGPAVTVPHKPEATWVYLGDGFPKYDDYPGTRLLIDVGSVGTQVEVSK